MTRAKYSYERTIRMARTSPQNNKKKAELSPYIELSVIFIFTYFTFIEFIFNRCFIKKIYEKLIQYILIIIYYNSKYVIHKFIDKLKIFEFIK